MVLFVSLAWGMQCPNHSRQLFLDETLRPADLGVDVQNIDGWIFKTMKDDAGKDFDVLLKPYSLDS